MRLPPIVGGRVACVGAILAFRAMPRPHLYPMPLHTPSLTHATHDTLGDFENEKKIFFLFFYVTLFLVVCGSCWGCTKGVAVLPALCAVGSQRECVAYRLGCARAAIHC